VVELTKKRSQLKQAVVQMVKECCNLVEKTPDKPTKLELIETLRSVTEGKVRYTLFIHNRGIQVDRLMWRTRVRVKFKMAAW